MKLELTKEELFKYALSKAGEVNNSDEEKYLHKNIYKAFVCQPIHNGIATTYEDVDKLIEESTTDDPKTTEDYGYEQIDREYEERKIVLAEWCKTLNDDEVATFNKLFDMADSWWDDVHDLHTIKRIINNK